MNFRPVRVANLIREELGKLLVSEVDFGGALATITEVRIDKKLEYAHVGVSVIPGKRADEVLKELKKNERHLEHLVFKKINIKPMPHIAFEVDYSFENAANVEKHLLKDANE
jgi:ribosome-binding factor A